MGITSAGPVPLALALLLGTAGCATLPTEGPDRDGASAVAGSPASATGTPTTIDTAASQESVPQPFPTDTRPSDGGHGSGNGLGVTDVRTMRHAGYDRVVFDLGGTGTPGWYAEYTTSPVYEGSGDPVTIKGAVVLMVVLRGVGLPFDTGLEPFGDDTTRVPGTGTDGVVEIAPGGVLEGEQGAYIGLTGARRPFRVFALADPARLVVDVSRR